ncbi:hypothetical protein JXB02_00470 [Candidatus Woesearchaeota archaeon]|nr:hypothetical protein [Candidatus Woesearchaeota archaeon]
MKGDRGVDRTVVRLVRKVWHEEAGELSDEQKAKRLDEKNKVFEEAKHLESAMDHIAREWDMGRDAEHLIHIIEFRLANRKAGVRDQVKHLLGRGKLPRPLAQALIDKANALENHIRSNVNQSRREDRRIRGAA